VARRAGISKSVGPHTLRHALRGRPQHGLLLPTDSSAHGLHGPAWIRSRLPSGRTCGPPDGHSVPSV